jgi:opacity protein-like surface antigen
MTKMILLIAAVMAISAPAAFAADHEGHDHGSMDMGHGDHSMMEMGDTAHQEVIDGVKATFKVMSMKEHMKGMDMPKGMKETHHIMVEFKDTKSGKALTEGEVKVKVQGPDKVEQSKDLMGMQGHFGADFNLSKKGKYGVMSKFQLKDGKVRQSKFWYTVK